MTRTERAGACCVSQRKHGRQDPFRVQHVRRLARQHRVEAGVVDVAESHSSRHVRPCVASFDGPWAAADGDERRHRERGLGVGERKRLRGGRRAECGGCVGRASRVRGRGGQLDEPRSGGEGVRGLRHQQRRSSELRGVQDVGDEEPADHGLHSIDIALRRTQRRPSAFAQEGDVAASEAHPVADVAGSRNAFAGRCVRSAERNLGEAQLVGSHGSSSSGHAAVRVGRRVARADESVLPRRHHLAQLVVLGARHVAAATRPHAVGHAHQPRAERRWHDRR